MSTTKPTTIEAYMATFSKSTQAILETVRNTIQHAAPDATEVISYGMPTFKINSKNLVHFAGYQTHIGFYPVPSGIAAFKEELSVFKMGKGSVQFPIDEPMPLTLIAKIVKFRLKEMTAK